MALSLEKSLEMLNKTSQLTQRYYDRWLDPAAQICNLCHLFHLPCSWAKLYTHTQQISFQSSFHLPVLVFLVCCFNFLFISPPSQRFWPFQWIPSWLKGCNQQRNADCTSSLPVSVTNANTVIEDDWDSIMYTCFLSKKLSCFCSAWLFVRRLNHEQYSSWL